MKVEPRLAEPPPARSTTRAYQASLFQPASNVIPFEAYVPVEPRPKPARSEAPPKPRASRRRPVPEEQGTLDFLAPLPPKPRTLSTTVEAVIFCDAPVAVPMHRAVASAIDWCMVLLAYGLFLGVFLAMGGSITLNKMTSPVYLGVLLLFGLLYGFVWAWTGGGTVGQRATRLKMLTFDGFPPERRQRLLRFAGSALSLGTVVGMTWSLVDEESLGWQDHMSRTFPTPQMAETLTLVRK